MKNLTNIYGLVSNPEILLTIKSTLSSFNFNLTFGKTIEELTEIIDGNEKFIFIFIIDLKIVSPDDFMAIHRIKNSKRYYKTPILFFGSNTLFQKLFLNVPFIKDSVYDFILDPIHNEEFKTRIVKLIADYTRFYKAEIQLKDSQETQKALIQGSKHKINKFKQEVRKKTLDLENFIIVSQEIAQIASQDLLNAFLLSIMGTTITSNICVFIKTINKKATYMPGGQKGLNGKEISEIIIYEKSKIIRDTVMNRDITDIKSLNIEKYPKEDKELIKKLNARYIIAIKNNNEILAILFIGEKLTKKDFQKEDFNKIQVICNQVGNTLQNNKLSQLRSMFSQYVSKDMIDFLIENPELLKLGGVKRHAVTMFADIRNFTAIAEKLDPEQVVNLLNTYFSTIAQIIIDNGGLLDKYIGDCVMAEFGVPLSNFDDIEKAARTALLIQKAIYKFNHDSEFKDLPSLQLGIGMHYGEVISGNLGSLNKMDYTVIGDNVNIASRLEGRAGPGQILITDEFLNPIKNFVNVSFIDEASLKGKSKKVKIYELHSFIDEEIFAYIQEKEPYRVNHVSQVSNLNTIMGKKLNYSDKELRDLKLATLLLDIGRKELDSSILASDKELKKDEHALIKKIPELNKEVLGKIGKFSDKVSELLEYFHENFDGSGYPNGIKGKKIPEWARVCRIADTYVALTSLRPYRKAMSKNKAIEELKKNRGTSFDPNLLNIFFEVIENKPLPA